MGAQVRRTLNREQVVEILERNVALYKDEAGFAHYLVELATYLLEFEYDWSESGDMPDTVARRRAGPAQSPTTSSGRASAQPTTGSGRPTRQPTQHATPRPRAQPPEAEVAARETQADERPAKGKPAETPAPPADPEPPPRRPQPPVATPGVQKSAAAKGTAGRKCPYCGQTIGDQLVCPHCQNLTR